MSVRPPGVSSILQAVEKRGETDSQPSYFVHVILPLIITVVGILLAVAVVIWQLGSLPEGAAQIPDAQIGVIVAAVLIAVLAIIAAAVLAFRGWYLLIKRRNEHLARDRVLRQGLIDYCRRVAETEGSRDAGEHLEAMERTHNEALLSENERPAVVHILLYVLTNGLWGLYVLYFLLKDFPQHARRQSRFIHEARAIFEDAGRDAEHVPAVDPLDERSYLLSVAMWIFLPIIGGLIVTWWLYEDPVEHFARQWEHEDALVELVQDEEAAPGAPAAAAGAPGPSSDSEEDDAPSDAPPSGGPDDEPGSPAEEPAEEEPEFTVWTCGECDKKYKVPPKRPVRVTCKTCGNKEILEE